MKKHSVVFLGKGGTGKTVCAALTGKLAIDQKHKVLFVDADPCMGLAHALQIGPVETLASLREKMIHFARQQGKNLGTEDFLQMLEDLLAQVLVEKPEYSFLALGQTVNKGCFCSVNAILRKAISLLSQDYDLVVVDAEAGVEQITRQVMEEVSCLVLVSDGSLRGLQTCLQLKTQIAQFPKLQDRILGVICNRSEGFSSEQQTLLAAENLRYLGNLPENAQIKMKDSCGNSLLALDANDSILQDLTRVLFTHLS